MSSRDLATPSFLTSPTTREHSGISCLPQIPKCLAPTLLEWCLIKCLSIMETRYRMTGEGYSLSHLPPGPSGLVFSALSYTRAPVLPIFSSTKVVALRLVTSCSLSPGDKQETSAAVDCHM